MGEIKLNVERMKEIVNRMDDVAFQLRAEMDSANGSVSSISRNINGDFVNQVLTNFMKLVEINREALNKNISELIEYLTLKISSYSETEEEASQSLIEIQNLLKGLE